MLSAAELDEAIARSHARMLRHLQDCSFTCRCCGRTTLAEDWRDADVRQFCDGCERQIGADFDEVGGF